MVNSVQGIGRYRNPANAHLHDHPDRPDGAWIETPQSSNVRRFAYVGAGYTDWLDIQFGRPGGKVRHYRYFGVPWSVYWAFVAADSKGRFRHQHINGYDYTEL